MVTQEDRNLLENVLLELRKKPRKFLGMGISEAVVFWTVLLAVAYFVLCSQNAFADVTWLKEFARKSDNYHTAQLGREFYQGAPVTPIERAKQNFIPDAHAAD